MSVSTPGRKNSRPRGYIENYNPQKKTKELLRQAMQVLDEYREYWPLSVRQLFYRCVAVHGFPKNESAYKRLCHHLANARRGRWIPFSAIRDDGLSTYALDHFEDHEAFLRHVRELGENYTRHKLSAQAVHIEVWAEAAGMLPQLYSVAEPFSIRVYSASGFDGLTLKKNLANRICSIGKPAVILHLGDLDPSGESIFEAVAEDVAAFVKADRPWASVSVEFERVALTKEQVRDFDLPTAPPKASDSRSKTWTGGTCQLEALPPDVIARILEQAIRRRLDPELLRLDRDLEELERRQIVHSLPAPEGRK